VQNSGERAPRPQQKQPGAIPPRPGSPRMR
jgi:hypothetical protein